MRLFLAVEVPQQVLAALEESITEVRAEFPQLAWTAPSRRHLTLKFLGDVDGANVASLARATDEVAARHRPFAMELNGFGTFPNARRARVLWVGVEQEARLELLHHDVEVACDQLGFELEGRAFRPHITLARMRSPVSPEDAKRLSRMLKRMKFTAAVAVEAITLFESTLASGGSRYRHVHVAPLMGGR